MVSSGRSWGPDKGRAETRSRGLGPTSLEHLCMYVWGPCPLSLCRPCGLEGDTCQTLTPWSRLRQVLSCVTGSGAPHL